MNKKKLLYDVQHVNHPTVSEYMPTAGELNGYNLSEIRGSKVVKMEACICRGYEVFYGAIIHCKECGGGKPLSN